MAFAPVAVSSTGYFGNEVPFSFAQLLDQVVCCNGRDDNQVFKIRAGAFAALGLLIAPTGTPVPTQTPSAGALTGTYLYRYRWVDASSGRIFSNSSPVFTQVLATQQLNFKFNEAPPSRATHWILERTLASGTVFYPTNRNAANPFGTAIATDNYTDNLADSDLKTRLSINNRFGKPKPFAWCFANLDRIFMGGRAVWETSIGVTNGTNAFTGTTGLNQFDVGRDVTIVGENRSYQIATVVGATGTFTENYASTTGTKNATVANVGNVVCISESMQSEGYGEAAPSPLSGLSNEFFVGTTAEPIIGGVGLGVQGVLYARESKLFYHAYSISPLSLTGDARIVELNTQRGIVNKFCLIYVEGYAYGIDQFGMWRMSPGNLPEDISIPIANDFKAMQIKYSNASKWFINFDPINRNVCFYVNMHDKTDPFPNYRIMYNVDKQVIVSYEPFDILQTASVVLPDTLGFERLCTFNAKTDSASAYLWFSGIGNSFGSNPANTLNVGTATGGSTTSIIKTAAGFYTTDDGLAAVPVRRIRGSDPNRVVEDKIIITNTADQLNIDPTDPFSSATIAGDVFIIGAIKSSYRSGRISLDKVNKNKQPSKIRSCELWLWVRYQVQCTPIQVLVYLDGNYVAASQWVRAVNEDGVSYNANGTVANVDGTTINRHIYKIPLGDWQKDISIEAYSEQPGEPWSILDMKLVFQETNDEVTQN